ncbi:protein SGT1 homolog A [Neltuma alba]|uniref:protein SGT1 homolog A n=1 Tax=Neltuma alba TaxID=207710 RepID=UPI0010A469BF|nr:protein SGT1 homolog A-like [Prosopis alba]
MASELEKKAKEAFFDDDFSLAIQYYSQAIDLDPSNADLLADRAQALIKLNNFTEAASDANKAIELDPSLIKAYQRKGAACLKLGQYHNAKVALETGASLSQNDSRFTKLIEECNLHITKESNGLTSSLSSNGAVLNVPPSTTEENERFSRAHQAHTDTSAKTRYRHEYYQKPDEVVLTIFAKGIPPKNAVVQFGEQILSVTIDVPGQEAYHYQSRLFGKIIPDKCRFEVLSTKIEIRLAKAEDINWASFEYSKGALPQTKSISSTGSHRPAYPSSKPKKDWDKLEAQVKKEEKEEKLDGDAGLNKLFRDIFQNADEDMRRAMTKSFVESNGTVLSTDWKEVGSKKVEGSPPEGMEMKKWEY